MCNSNLKISSTNRKTDQLLFGWYGQLFDVCHQMISFAEEEPLWTWTQPWCECCFLLRESRFVWFLLDLYESLRTSWCPHLYIYAWLNTKELLSSLTCHLCVCRLPENQQRIGGFFLNLMPQIKILYVAYCSNHPSAVNVLTQHRYNQRYILCLQVFLLCLF